MAESVRGTIEHIIFRNEDNGYTVFSLSMKGKELTCVGYLDTAETGLTVDAEGQMTEHPVYGRQFKVASVSIHVPETKEEIEKYLGCGAIKGIGKSMAARIVKTFGDDTLRIMEEEPERLAEIKGISMKGAQKIAEQVAKETGLRRAMLFLQKYEIPHDLSIRIYKKYGEKLYDVLQQNPYQLAEDIDGVGFLKADRIAARVGIAADSEYRIKSGLLYCLMNASLEGSVYLPEKELFLRAGELLGSGEEAMEHAVEALAMERKVVVKRLGDDIVVYAGRYYYLESDTARMLLDLNIPMGISDDDVSEKIAAIEKTSEFEPEEEQVRAVRMAASHGVLVMTGGPGTGKTTTINQMIRYFKKEKKNILLAAPTGRAAKRMTETTGYEAQTIHRMLEVSGSDDKKDKNGSGVTMFGRNEENPLEADVVIIDEMSMVDISLMHALLKALTPGMHLILVGDVDQLPSVGPGSVLKDIIASEAFPTVTLTHIFRQAATSDIVVNAHRINKGEDISFDNQSRDFFFLERSDTNRIIANSIQLIRDMLPRYVDAPWSEIQVLTPMRKGALGVEKLNGDLQRYLNPPAAGKKEKAYGDHVFRVGDKVMQIRNDYQMSWEIRGKYNIPVEHGEGIFNGDMGTIRDIEDMSETMLIEFDGGKFVDYPYAGLDELMLSYAITIHKSQGSEYPAVILPLLSGPRMLMNRNLLYTAVTRARKCVVILGSRDAVLSMIHNEMKERRYTSLAERICELCLP
ncbi:MAG: ATP-dependent RecD-like DNA helicase [Lachnospiraceae bacterium]|nr:ATP-dependent RecD-like DNA helicase [Lachnospiraceae bacterium]